MFSTTSTNNIFSLLANLAIEDEDRHTNADGAKPICSSGMTTPQSSNDSSTFSINSSIATSQISVPPAEATIVASDDYRPDDDEFVASFEEDDDDTDLDFDAIHTTFDLLDQNQQNDHKPIFTKNLLQHVAKDVACIMADQSKPVGKRTASFIHYKPINSQSVKIWKAVNNANSITVHYMTRVELCRGFQEQFGTIHNRSKTVRGLNPGMPEDWIPAPYYIESYCRLPDTTHLDSALMNQWRSRLLHTQTLWSRSTSRATLLEAVQLGAAKLKSPITKIVCLGLGKLNADPVWYESALQHMSMFSIAECLNCFNKAKYPGASAVMIIAQDPCYDECDWMLLQELTSTPITFGHSDPETFLAIDANTLVVSAFLPFGVPLMQIVADMFSGEMGPTMLLWDKVEDMRVGKRWYCMRNRDSPSVARLLKGYKRWGSGFSKPEEVLEKDVWGSRKERKYWLDGMDFWLRDDGAK